MKHSTYKPIPQFNGVYAINIDGTEVISYKKPDKPLVLKQFNQMYDYKIVNLYYDGKNYTSLVHHLVMQTYGDPKPDQHNIWVITHLDGNKNNNHISNLKWILRTDVQNHPDSAVEATGVDDNDIIKFRNLSATAKYFHTNQNYIKSKIEAGVVYKGYIFKWLNR